MSTVIVDPAPVLCQITDATIVLVPMNDVAKNALNTFFTTHGTKVVVAVTRETTPRDGVGLATGPYYNVTLALA